jgi:hypothetical protein
MLRKIFAVSAAIVFGAMIFLTGCNNQKLPTEALSTNNGLSSLVMPSVVAPPIGQTIWLKAQMNGDYVSAWSADANAPLESRSTAVNTWENFTVVDAGNGFIALKASANNLYVSAWKATANSPLQARAATVSTWEQFKWIDDGNGLISLQAAANNLYVSTWNDPNQPLEARASVINTWEQFQWGALGPVPTATASMTPTPTVPASLTASATASPTSTDPPTSTGTSSPTQTMVPPTATSTLPSSTATRTNTPVPTCGTANMALNRTVTSSSNENASYTPDMAADGNTATRWSSAYSDPQWIQVDLGSTQSICRVVLRWEVAYGKSYQIQTSNDGMNWTSIYSTTTGAGGTENLTVAGSGRYVRMNGTARGTAYGYSLWEFEIYGSGGPGPTFTPTATGIPSSCNQSPADPNANSKARNLLCYLKTHSYVSGQTDAADGDKVKSLTGRYPAIMAFDFMNYTSGSGSSGNIDTQNVINWYNSHHGIVAFQWHWYCPYGGNYSAQPCNFQNDLNNPGSKLYQDIDLIARELKKLGDAGIPVLFRPLHEANNNYMWWTKQGPGNYIALYRLIYQRVMLAGAHNVLFVFNGMASGQSTALSQWYPGDAYVDFVTSDYFQSASDLNTCKAIGNNKTVGISETMNQLNPANAPAWPFSVVWASRDWNGTSASDWQTAMANPKTISIDQLPDMTQW